MRTTLLTNPYFCYIISFGLALFIYSWGWSELYPTLTFDVVIFLLTSFLIAFIMGRKISKRLAYKNIPINKNSVNIIALILLSYTIEFIYNGGIPLITVLRGINVDYMAFGIPTFHVILHTFTSFYTVYVFHQYVSSKNNKLLLYGVILLLPHILAVNRGALIMEITACLIVYLFAIGKVLLSRVIIILVSASMFFYGFGYLGNARSFNGDPTALLKFTSATDNFLDNSIPKEYYWFYLYASSPFANFQNATITSTKHRYDFLSFVTWEMLPDFISKRIIPMEADYDGSNRLDYSIHPTLTVGSVYFEPYIRLGWYGPIIIFLYYIVVVYLYVNSISTNSKYFVSAIAILCVISIYNMFENMLNFSGLSLQLVFPLLLNSLEKYKIRFVGFDFKRINLVFFSKRIRFRW